jgi:hypothetical protein
MELLRLDRGGLHGRLDGLDLAGLGCKKRRPNETDSDSQKANPASFHGSLHWG